VLRQNADQMRSFASLRMATTSRREACDGRVRCDDVGSGAEGADVGKAAASRRTPKKF
jgi:hypothetical protein